VEDKWGPPAKIGRREDQIIYYYYFQKGKAVVVGSSTVASGQLTSGWVVVEFTADSSGRILKTRKYWKQPTIEPQLQEK